MYPGFVPDLLLCNMCGGDIGKPCSFQPWNSGSITDSIVVTVLSEKRGWVVGRNLLTLCQFIESSKST